MYHSQPGRYAEEQARLALAFGNQAAVAIENSRLYEQAQELAAIEERQHLARELHDAVSQTLFSASLAADVLPRLWERDREAGLRCLSEVRQLTRGALAEMRMLLLELRPAARVETELGALLSQLAEATTNRARIQVTVRAAPQCPLPPEVQVALYRMAQEALNNVAKHAAAQHADVELRCTLPVPSGEGGRPVTEVELCVVDDGCGFDPARLPTGSRGLGLHIMRERAGAIGASLRIESRPGEGTQVTVRWPEED
jgi:two-component system nitrate/nitrite sensor histidine kinase NarX